jgi:hypothetical protein
MHIEEGDAIAFAKRVAFDISERTSDPIQRACRDMAGNDRVWDARQTAMPQMHIGPAHLGQCGVQQRTPDWKFRLSELSNLYRRVWSRHHRSKHVSRHHEYDIFSLDDHAIHDGGGCGRDARPKTDSHRPR